MKRIGVLTALLGLLWAGTVQAKDITLVGTPDEFGKIKFENNLYPAVLNNAVEKGQDPDGVKFMHSSGITQVPYELLPGYYRATLGFTEEQTAQFRAEKKAKLLASAAAMQASQNALHEQKLNGIREKAGARQAETETELTKLRAQAPAKIRELEDAMASIINKYANRRFVKPALREGWKDRDKAAIVRSDGGWWPYSPVGHADLNRSMQAKDLMEQHAYWSGL